MPTCAVLSCGNRSDTKNVTKGGISYFGFPKDPITKEAWINCTGKKNWMPRSHDKLCSDHFDAKYVTISPKGRKYLVDKTVPTKGILMHHEEVQFFQTAAPAQSAGPSSSTIAQRDAASAEEGTPLNSDDDDSDDAGMQIDTGADEDLSLYLNLPEKSTEHTKSRSVASASDGAVFNKSGELHEGINCNSCSGPITGFRYTCVQCSNYDLCGSCEASGAHCLHYVLRIPKPAPFAEIQCVLSKIRTQLLYGADKETEHDSQTHTTELAEETIKVEIKEELADPLETEDDAFQADDDYTETNKEHTVPTDQMQPSQPLNVNASILTLTETDKNLLIIENPVSASSGAAHTAVAADRTKRKLAHKSTVPPHVSEKRVRVTHAPAQSSANLLTEVPITGPEVQTVPVTIVPRKVPTVPVTTVPQVATPSAPGGIVASQCVVTEESSFQVFSHSAKIPQDQAQAADSPQTTGKASASSRTKKKSASNK